MGRRSSRSSPGSRRSERDRTCAAASARSDGELDDALPGEESLVDARLERVAWRRLDLLERDATGLRLAEAELDEVTLDGAKLARAEFADVVVRGGSWANVRAER